MSPQVRSKILNRLCKMCGRKRSLPKSMVIACHQDVSTIAEYGGRFAEVHRGEYNGRPVAIKVMKFYVTDDRDLLLSVCTLSHAIRKTKKALTWSLVVVLSGSRYMEAPTTPKYPTITRRDAGRAGA